jgi:hypothetical protein
MPDSKLLGGLEVSQFVVGSSITNAGATVFVWDAAGGMRDLKDVFERTLGSILTAGGCTRLSTFRQTG